MNEALEMLVPVLGRALLNFLWQGALIGLVATVLLQAARNARPQLRYAIACLALLACAAAHERDALQTNLLRDLIQKAFAGSGKDLVLAALSEHVSAKEREEIHRFLKEDIRKENGDE